MENLLFLTDGPVSLRPLIWEDAPLLLKWLTDSRVLEWYEGRDVVFTPERIREDFYEESPDEPDMRRCIVEYEGAPVGYVQVYPLDAAGFREYGYPHPERRTFAMDQFLGEPDCWNKGVGRRFISMILTHLTDQEGAEAVLLDPHADNFRALHCYEACGFQRKKLLPAHELHEGQRKDCWLMEYRSHKK